MQTTLDVINAFGGPTRMARALGVGVQTAHAWKRRNSIPPAYFADIIAAAPDHGVKITWAELHALRKETAQ